MQTIKELVDSLRAKHGDVVRRKDIFDAAEAHGFKTHDIWKELCQPAMRAQVRGQFDLSKWGNSNSNTQKLASPKKLVKQPDVATLESAFESDEQANDADEQQSSEVNEPKERRKFNLEGRPQPYPNIYYWNPTTYVLVKDGEHYPIHRNKMDIMVRESRGHHEEIAKHYIPRVRKERKPRVVNTTAVESTDSKPRTGRTSTVEWIEPSMIHPSQKSMYSEDGFRKLS